MENAIHINPFTYAGKPHLIFAAGAFERLGEIAAQYGNHALIVTGGSSLQRSGYYHRLVVDLEKNNIKIDELKVVDEPSPDLVDETVTKFRDKNIAVVIAIGGGSVMDAGKAISAMLLKDESVMEYIEGVGAGREHDGEKVPFIAVPTTSGTGSEATKNAVLSRVGSDGFKKSLRHDNFIPDIALLDPGLTFSCPPEITAASGLDALTQLLGAYLSTEASPLTDALTFDGIRYVKSCLIPACTDRAQDIDIRAGMAYASFLSGVGLANAGLGIVHGLASPIGGYFDIPHGVVCGTLLGAAVQTNITLLRKMRQNDEQSSETAKDAALALKKYARAGALFSGSDDGMYYCESLTDSSLPENFIDKNCDCLIEIIESWIEKLRIPRLGEYGLTESDLDKIVEKTGNKNNPVQLTPEQIKQILLSRL